MAGDPDRDPEPEPDPGPDDGWLLAGPTAPEDVRRHYDGWAPEYDAELAAWGYDAPVQAARLLLAHDPRPAMLLDAGCGTGLVGRALRDGGFAGTLTGIDLSAASLDLAGRRDVYDALATADLQQRLWRCSELSTGFTYAI